MENSSRALIMAGGVLVAVMVLSLWVYVFKRAAAIGQNYDAGKQGEQLVAFNAQFETYGEVSVQDNASGYFKNKSNRPADVISCANLVNNINKKNDYDDVNNVELEVEIGSKKLHIYPMGNQPKNAFIVGGKNSTSYVYFNDFLKEYNEVKILDATSATDHIAEQETIYKYYFDVYPKNIQYSESTGKVNKIIFSIYETKKYF